MNQSWRYAPQLPTPHTQTRAPPTHQQPCTLNSCSDGYPMVFSQGGQRILYCHQVMIAEIAVATAVLGSFAKKTTTYARNFRMEKLHMGKFFLQDFVMKPQFGRTPLLSQNWWNTLIPLSFPLLHPPPLPPHPLPLPPPSPPLPSPSSLPYRDDKVQTLVGEGLCLATPQGTIDPHTLLIRVSGIMQLEKKTNKQISNFSF